MGRLNMDTSRPTKKKVNVLELAPEFIYCRPVGYLASVSLSVLGYFLTFPRLGLFMVVLFIVQVAFLTGYRLFGFWTTGGAILPDLVDVLARFSGPSAYFSSDCRNDGATPLLRVLGQAPLAAFTP